MFGCLVVWLFGCLNVWLHCADLNSEKDSEIRIHSCNSPSFAIIRFNSCNSFLSERRIYNPENLCRFVGGSGHQVIYNGVAVNAVALVEDGSYRGRILPVQASAQHKQEFSFVRYDTFFASGRRLEVDKKRPM